LATLLDAVNAVGSRAKFLDTGGKLTQLEDSARQLYIDVAIQCWNEAIVELYDAAREPMPTELVEAVFQLVANQRLVSLPAGLVKLHFPLIQQSQGYQIFEADYLAIQRAQLTTQNFIGRPNYAAIDPVTGDLFLDRTPTIAEAGEIYTMWYDKDVLLSDATDTMPFNDTVYKMLIPAVTEKWKIEFNKEFTDGLWAKQMGLAARHLSRSVRHSHYF
jgi:hypothetical protein